MTFEELTASVGTGAIDTVLVCTIDMQGRLMGKRYNAEAFLEIAHKDTHCCTYMLATDLEMATPDGYATSSWDRGYGDYHMVPDLTTIRPVPWLEATALVLCDIIDPATHKPAPHAPREMLKRQIARAEAMGLSPMMATELEFFLFYGTHDEIRANGFRDLRPISHYNQDYHIFQTTKEEPILRPIRNHLRAMGVPVESSKGEAEQGQEELNIKYAAALDCADHHLLAKHAIKEIAHLQGYAASFLPKWRADRVGTSAHVHQSLWRDGKNVFADAARPHGKSEIMDHYMAGLLTYARDLTYFMAPYVNSYKRFIKGTFAPTAILWAVDNRTAAFRLVGEGSSSVRVECRMPGGDANPYLSMAAMLAAGLAGIEQKLSLSEAYSGNAYKESDFPHVPTTLREARELLLGSDMLRTAFGEDVITHYARAAEWELEEFDRAVTDYELYRGFERA